MNHDALTEEELELIMLRQILIGNISSIKLILQSINEERRKEILKSLVTYQAPSIYAPTKFAPSPLNIKWIASRLLLLEGCKDFPSVNYQGLALIDFSNMIDAATQFFKFSLSRVENRPPDESKIISFAESFLQFYNKRLSLSECLLTSYTDYFIQVPLSKLFRNFQFRCFLLINNLDKIDLNTLDANFSSYNDYPPFRDLFQIYNGYQKEDFFPTFQEMIIKDKLFPNTIGTDPEKIIRSLIDTSLLKKDHFVEVLGDYSYSLFKEGKIDESIEKARLIRGIEPWIFISHHYSSIKEISPSSLPISVDDTINFFTNMSYELFENSENSIAADFLNRLQNDNSFFNMIRQNTGQTINGSFLLDHSIPFFLILFLKHEDPLPFKDMNETRMFVVNDKDRLIDADFVWSYFAEVVAINALTKPDEAEDMIAQTGWYLSQINDTKVHHDVLIDIFSILFLQQEIETENHERRLKYVCYQSVAEIILTMILGVSDDPVLMQQAQSGHILIQFARSISSGIDFEDLIFPKEQKLLKAFQNEDWLIADHIAALNVRLSDMNILYKTVNEYLKKSKFHDLLNEKVDSFVSFHFDPSKSKSKFASVEIGLSFPDQTEALKAATEIKAISGEISELINKRYKKVSKENGTENNYNNVLKAVKTLNSTDFTVIKKNFSDLNSSNWTSSRLSNEKTTNCDHLYLLKTFLFYLDSLIGVVLNEEKLVNNVSEVLKEEPSLFVNKLFNKGSIAASEKVSKVIKRDLMLMLASENSASEEVINQVMNENLPFALTLALSKEDGMNSNPIQDKNSIAYKLANLALKSNENRKDEIDIILGKQRNDFLNDETKLNELKEIFESQLLKDNFDIEKITNISYCLTESQFSNTVLQYININNDYLIKIIEIVNSCASVSPLLYDSAMFLKFYLDSKIQIYPFEGLFVHLLDNKKFKEASKFCSLLGDKIENRVEHLIKAYSSQPGSKYEILNISPSNKAEIESRAAFNMTKEEYSREEDGIDDDCYFDDLSVIKEKLIDNPQIDLDGEIYKAVLYDSENGIYSFCNTFRKAIYLLKNTDSIIDLSLSTFEREISHIHINSNQKEDDTWQILNKIYSIFERKVISRIHSKSDPVTQFMQKILIMRSIVDHSPYHLFECEYKFTNFGKDLSFIFPKIDLITSLHSYQTAFNISKSDFEYDPYILDCCKLGITDFQLPCKIEPSRYKNEEVEKDDSQFYRCGRSLYEDIAILLSRENQFFEPLLISSFISQFPPTEEMLEMNLKKQVQIQSTHKNSKDTEKVRRTVNKSSSISFGLDDPQPPENERVTKLPSGSNSLPSLLLSVNLSNDHFFKRIDLISNQGSSTMFEIEPLRKVSDFFRENAPIDLIVSFFTFKGDLTSAIKLLNESEKQYDKKCQQELFKSCFFEKVISRGDDVKISLKNVMTIDKELLMSVLPDSGPYLRFEIFSFMKEWHQAFKAAIDLFCIPQNDQNAAKVRALNLLTWMENCLEKITEESEEKELSKIQVSLQREVCLFAINNNINCNFSETNLFKNDNQKESVVIFLLTHFNIKLAIAILRFFMLNRFRIGERFCDIFINEDPKNATLFFKKFQKEIDIYMFREIFYSICLRMKHVLEVDPQTIHSYISVVEDKDFKRKLLYQFGYLDEATEHAFSEGDIEMVAMIANDAYLLQKWSLLSKCLKYIEKNSK